MNTSLVPHYMKALECLAPGVSIKSSKPEDFHRLAIVDVLLKPDQELEIALRACELQANLNERGRLQLIVRKEDGKRYRAGVITKRRLDRLLRATSR
jgi:hypothetical protein